MATIQFTSRAEGNKRATITATVVGGKFDGMSYTELIHSGDIVHNFNEADVETLLRLLPGFLVNDRTTLAEMLTDFTGSLELRTR